MPTLKGTEVLLLYVQCFWYLLSSSINVSIFHIIWVDSFWTNFVRPFQVHRIDCSTGHPETRTPNGLLNTDPKSLF